MRKFELTTRELDVINTYGNKTNFNRVEACDILGISIGTFKTHTRSILGKLYAYNLTEAYFVACQKGYLAMERYREWS